jgi:hypothetical protein
MALQGFPQLARQHQPRQGSVLAGNKPTVDGSREHIIMKQTVLRHVEGALFAGPAGEGITHLLEAPVVGVGRRYMPAENKVAADAEIKETVAALREFAAPHDTRCDRVVDPKDEQTQSSSLSPGGILSRRIWHSSSILAPPSGRSSWIWRVPRGFRTTSGFPE